MCVTRQSRRGAEERKPIMSDEKLREAIRPYVHFPQRPDCKSYLKRRTREMTAGEHAWDVPALCRAYNFPTRLDGGGVIAIIELDGGWTQEDMDKFFRDIDQPLPHITNVSVDGTQNNPNQHLGDPRDPDGEVALDIQVAAAA